MTTIKLFCFKKPPDAPSLSGYCNKVETFIRATGQSDKCTLVPTTPFRAPKGKLPYIELEKDGKTEKIADSHFIICRLVDAKVVEDLDANLSPAERGDTRAWQAWTEELIFPAVVYTRWCYPGNYAVMVKLLPVPNVISPLLGWFLRRRVRNALTAAGVGRHSNTEIEMLLREYVDALDAKLVDTYFFGKTDPTLIDVILYGFLSDAFINSTCREYTTMLMSSERIKKYVANLTKKWFPEYKALLEKVEN